MRFVSYLDHGTETLGVLREDRVVSVPSLAPGMPATMAELLANPELTPTVLPEAGTGIPVAELTLLSPVPSPRNIICVGRNYREHAEEQDTDTPEEPALFLKATSSVTGPNAPITWDTGYTGQVDYEAELAVVIGRTARNVPEETALSHVFGYTCLNDVSARDLQFGDLQWARGKSLDTFCPMGPALVTADEVGDPQSLRVRAILNGQTVQDADTAVMYHSVAKIIAYCSRAFTLRPGDVIATGTPGGVGIFREPPLLLSDGDEIVVEIAKVGRLVNHCRTVKDLGRGESKTGLWGDRPGGRLPRR